MTEITEPTHISTRGRRVLGTVLLTAAITSGTVALALGMDSIPDLFFRPETVNMSSEALRVVQNKAILATTLLVMAVMKAGIGLHTLETPEEKASPR